MLRISLSADDAVATVRLDGKLLHPWIDEVRTTVSRAAAGGRPLVNLEGLTFADQAGIAFLHELTASGVVVQGASPFINELLANFTRHIR